jgi:hypothetical protein
MGSNQLNKLPDFIEGFECIEPLWTRDAFNFPCVSLLKTAQKQTLIFSTLVLVNVVLLLILKACPSSFMENAKDKASSFTKDVAVMLVCSTLLKTITFVANLQSARLQSLACLALSLIVLLGYAWRLVSIFKQKASSSRLKPSYSSQVYFGLVILHRLVYSGVIVAVNWPSFQLAVLSTATCLVTFK